MFVLQSTYDDLKLKYMILQMENDKLIDQWNNLVRKINALGGEDFLKRHTVKHQFSPSEIRTLIKLCHPDKHNGKKEAHDMTVKLLELKT